MSLAGRATLYVTSLLYKSKEEFEKFTQIVSVDSLEGESLIVKYPNGAKRSVLITEGTSYKKGQSVLVATFAGKTFVVGDGLFAQGINLVSESETESAELTACGKVTAKGVVTEKIDVGVEEVTTPMIIVRV